MVLDILRIFAWRYSQHCAPVCCVPPVGSRLISSLFLSLGPLLLVSLPVFTIAYTSHQLSFSIQHSLGEDSPPCLFIQSSPSPSSSFPPDFFLLFCLLSQSPSSYGNYLSYPLQKSARNAQDPYFPIEREQWALIAPEWYLSLAKSVWPSTPFCVHSERGISDLLMLTHITQSLS